MEKICNLNINRRARAIGYEPQYNLEDGLREVVEWMGLR